ncbi:MAG: hypothetical protein EKK64_10390 [Neisseriaceae bacterium]|nr:MAG: hypothetical protein EKK64_10390 [Neisseriaceae bacterium]
MGTCTPPYCLGTGGFCDCNCNCCPPDPCYDAWNYVFHCGTPIASWEGPINQGCDCPPSGLGLTSNSLGINFPKFDTKEFEFSLKEDTVSALTSVCSIPCESTTVRITTSGCCLYFIDIFHFKAVGAGIITANFPVVCDSNFQILVNNVDISGGLSVADCTDLYITIIPPANECCSCCLKDNFGELHTGGSPLVSTKTSNGIKKILVNQELYKKQLLRKMLRTR